MSFLFNLNIHGYNVLMIPWNLFLIFIPCVVVWALARAIRGRRWKQLRIGEKISFAFLFLFWLAFFPNTAYQFMIPRHLVSYCTNYDIYRVCPNETWLVVLFFTYAALGIPAFYYSAFKMAELLERLWNGRIKAIFPILLMPVTAIGVFLGLFYRLNSWDLIFRPLDILRLFGRDLVNPAYWLNLVVFTACLYLIYYGLQGFIALFNRRP